MSVRRLLLLGGAAAALWAWLRRSGSDSTPATPAPPVPVPPPPVEPEAASDADPTGREVESRLDEQTKYERAVDEEAEARRRAADQLRADPLTERLDAPPDDAA